MIYIAIDPGLTGAIAAIDDESSLILCEDLPVIRHGAKLAWIDANGLTDLLMTARSGRPARITVERSQARPGQGVSSTFTTGCVMGSILSACQRVALPLEIVAPVVWKGAMGLALGTTWAEHKSSALDLGRLKFPTAPLDRRMDHNRAEALLLAEYSRRAFAGRVAA